MIVPALVLALIVAHWASLLPVAPYWAWRLGELARAVLFSPLFLPGVIVLFLLSNI